MPLKETTPRPAIVWFRRDLRLADNGALAAAAAEGRPVIALYVMEPDGPDGLALGAAQRWWLHHSLDALARSLQPHGVPLVLRTGTAVDVLEALVAQTGAEAIYWNRHYTPQRMATDSALKASLIGRGLEARSFPGALMHEPTKVRTGTGGPFKVYTPFWRAFGTQVQVHTPQEAPADLIGYAGSLQSDTLADWNLLPKKPDWSGGLADAWTPGEAGAQERLAAFCEGPLDGYSDNRNLPDRDSTSRLSPHLAFGEITPAQAWWAAKEAGRIPHGDLETFQKELVWREFSWHLLANFDDLKTVNFNRTFDAFPWADDEALLAAWERGQTGYPIIDAGMRQLWQTGWMHNRVRMIVGSFLVKHSLIDWRHGEKWFWDTLVDADAASNTASWQWVAGSGADAAPYFRVFNPVLQGEKFDPEGRYVKLFVPELVDLDMKYIHKPWDAPPAVLARAGIALGRTYPRPVVGLAEGRDKALKAYKDMRGEAA